LNEGTCCKGAEFEPNLSILSERLECLSTGEALKQRYILPKNGREVLPADTIFLKANHFSLNKYFFFIF
jgi:hypothetical protein